MKRKGKLGKNKSVGYGWVGRWNGEELGWVLPTHLSGEDVERPDKDYNWVRNKDQLTLCKITIEAVKNKRGKNITKKMLFFRKDE